MMRKYLLIFLGLAMFAFSPAFSQEEDSNEDGIELAADESDSNVVDNGDENPSESDAVGNTDSGEESEGHTATSAEAGTEHGGGHDDAHHDPALWSIIPFVLLLLMIATGPLFFEHFWHKFYPLVAIVLGSIVVVYYVFVLGDAHHPVHALAEYVSFIALIASLFIASGGILIKIDREGKPLLNVALLVVGALIANVIGTTGASMLLIRPFIRLNENRVKPYHIVFFIFMVSNVGGCLTPIGDPPLFLGFLKGVPFFWTLTHVWLEWIVGIGLLAAIFYFIDRRNKADYDGPDEQIKYSGKISLKGARNIIWLAVVIAAVFLDPNKMGWLPGIIQLENGEVLLGITDNLTAAQNLTATKFSVIRELIMFTVAILAYKTADKECLKGNEFDFEPVKEVAFIFIGIFATMMPALQLVGSFARTPEGSEMIGVNSLYWFTGSLSGVLDNAPTYMNFLSAGMGKAGMTEMTPTNVMKYVEGADTHWELMAISVSAVFFGAMTYIGNAPNFMVKSIAEQTGVKMPAFMTYVVKYSIPILLPVLLIVWVLFFVVLK